LNAKYLKYNLIKENNKLHNFNMCYVIMKKITPTERQNRWNRPMLFVYVTELAEVCECFG